MSLHHPIENRLRPPVEWNSALAAWSAAALAAAAPSALMMIADVGYATAGLLALFGAWRARQGWGSLRYYTKQINPLIVLSLVSEYSASYFLFSIIALALLPAGIAALAQDRGFELSELREEVSELVPVGGQIIVGVTVKAENKSAEEPDLAVYLDPSAAGHIYCVTVTSQDAQYRGEGELTVDRVPQTDAPLRVGYLSRSKHPQVLRNLDSEDIAPLVRQGGCHEIRDRVRVAAWGQGGHRPPETLRVLVNAISADVVGARLRVEGQIRQQTWCKPAGHGRNPGFDHACELQLPKDASMAEVIVVRFSGGQPIPPPARIDVLLPEPQG